MKKGLLLSIVASTVIFAGGDIAPVEPAAPAADCSDFSGQVGVFYQTIDSDVDTDLTDNDLFGSDVSSLVFSAQLSVQKNINDVFGFGAQASGWTTTARDSFRATRRGSQDGGALNQLYLTASFGNTAVKVGRFALSSALSPLMRTGGTAGAPDTTYEGVLVANTDIADTVIYGVWASAAVYENARTKFVDDAGDNVGAFALGFQNKSIANTTITAVGYYRPEQSTVVTGGTSEDLVGAVVAVKSAVSDYTVDAQVAYVDDGSADAAVNAALKVSGKIGMVNAWAGVNYKNASTAPLNMGAGQGGILGDGWDSDMTNESMSYGAGISAALGMGTASLAANYVDRNDNSNRTRIFVGYSMTVSGVKLSAQYRYEMSENTAGVANPDTARVRLGAKYAF